MTPSHADRLSSLIIETLERTAQRGVIVSGWGGLGSGPLPSTIFHVRDVPHEWLFPRMRAIVHHGGSGTTGAALRSGVPSVVVPLSFDQPYWGRRVAALGVGTEPIPRLKLTTDRLVTAINRAIGDEGLCARAAQLGAALRAEHGVETAVEVVESVEGRG